MMNATQLRVKCKEVAKQHWGLDFNLPVEISKKMTAKMGKMEFFKLLNGYKPKRLVFSHQALMTLKPETFNTVIAHEVCHWALCIQNKPFADNHPYFESELKRVGGSSTHTIKQAGELHKIVCVVCEKTVFLGSKRKKDNLMKADRMYSTRTSCCNALYKYVGTEIVEDSYSLK